MRSFKILALTALTSLSVFAGSTAKAGLLLEPYLGYELGKLEHTTANVNYDLSSAALGLRLGVTFPVVFIAADYSTLIGGSLKQDNNAGTKWDATASQLFGEVGVSLPLIRAYVGYGLMNSMELKSGNVSNKFEGGTAFKVGIGTSIFPMISANLEYINSTYDKVNGDSNQKSKSNFYMLNLSVPFTL